MTNKKIGTVCYLELNLGNSSAITGRFPFDRFRPDTELETLRILKRAALDKKLRGIFVNTSGFSANREYLWELRNVLEFCKSSGKKTTVYFDNADFDLYCFLSGADKIVMDQMGMLSFQGYSWGRLFVKESLEKLGVGFRELRYLEYKSAGEMFSRTSISDADREQYGAYLDEIFNLSKETIIRSRSINDDDFNSLLKEGFILSPGEAKNRKLADALGREEAVRETIKKMEFGEGEEGELRFVSAGNPGYSFFNQSRKVPRYAPGRGRKFRPSEIAVIHAKGNTDLEQGMGARKISALIRELSEKPRVKALVIRMDSPGGSSVAADFIASAIEDAKKKIPLVVSMGQTAASGGYWASMYASHITASPYTLTGSIGVIAGWFFDKGLYAKLGLGVDTLTRGEHADLTTGIIIPRRDLTEEEELRFRSSILDLYGTFVEKAAKARNMKNEDMEALARGRVYSGLSAQRLGLVDSVGGYLEALDTARKLAEIREDKKIRIREYPKPKMYRYMAERLLSSVISTDRGSVFGNPSNATIRQIRDDLRYRISHNGEAMPVLPLPPWQRCSRV